jgi:hypothetical protein
MDEKRQLTQLRRATRRRDRSHVDPDGSLPRRRAGSRRPRRPGRQRRQSRVHRAGAGISTARCAVSPACSASASIAELIERAITACSGPGDAHTARSARADRGIDVCRPAGSPCAKPNQGTGRSESSTKPPIPTEIQSLPPSGGSIVANARRQALSAASSRSDAPQDRACAAACNSLISRPWFQ